MKPQKPRLSKCPICKGMYHKWSSTQKVCLNLACALEMARLSREKKEAKERREAKIKAKTRREWVALAQQSFNAFIRARDVQEPCICCGEWPKTIGKYGGDWDAGHFLSVGAHLEKRFLEDNCHKQQKSCNAGSGKYSYKEKTVSQGYRERLIIKIGLERVEALESMNEPAKYTIKQLIEIRDTYRRKLKELNK